MASDYTKAPGKPDRIVVALGGNALGDNPSEQMERIDVAAPALLGLIELGNEIVITHGNGPQVGMIQKSFATANDINREILTQLLLLFLGNPRAPSVVFYH